MSSGACASGFRVCSFGGWVGLRVWFAGLGLGGLGFQGFRLLVVRWGCGMMVTSTFAVSNKL